MFKKIMSAALACACMASAVAGTGISSVSADNSAKSASRNFTYKGSLPTNGDKLTILSYNTSEIESIIRMWMEDTGYTDEQVNIVNLAIGGGEAATYYEKYFTECDDIDIFIVEPDWALKYMNDDSKTVPMTELGFSENDFSDQYKYANQLCRDSNGVLKASSWNVSPGAWCYRTDLAEKYLGVSTPEEMQEKVSNFWDFGNTAEEVYNASNGQTALTTTVSGMWYAITGNKNMPWVVDGKFNTEINDNELMLTARYVKTMRDHGFITDRSMWTTDWHDIGQTDETMGYFVPSWGISSILLNAAGGTNGATYGKWGICQGPASYYWGGNMMCVHPRTDNADMAADFIDYFTVNSETMKKCALTDPDHLPNNMTAAQEIADEGLENDSTYDDLLGGQNRLAVFNESAKNINLTYESVTTYDSRIEVDFLTALHYYCNGTIADEEAFLEDFKKRISEYVYVESFTDDFLRGDISRNGKYDLYDAIEIAKYMVGIRTFTEEEMDIADYDNNGTVDLYDAIGIAVEMAKNHEKS
ncbi:MAG: ABC transporter substrate-binding protein [Clostridium sp.]|nr:ABC transporter substrate-binding protein [Clostridium sp.]MCM1546784.1 ABC transporter substrate-binding protein [Ruminococcus sp.]